MPPEFFEIDSRRLFERCPEVDRHGYVKCLVGEIAAEAGKKRLIANGVPDRLKTERTFAVHDPAVGPVACEIGCRLIDNFVTSRAKKGSEIAEFEIGIDYGDSGLGVP